VLPGQEPTRPASPRRCSSPRSTTSKPPAAMVISGIYLPVEERLALELFRSTKKIHTEPNAPNLHQSSATARALHLSGPARKRRTRASRSGSSCPGEARGGTPLYAPASPTPEMVSPPEVQDAGRLWEKPFSGRGTNPRRRRWFPHHKSTSMHHWSAVVSGRGQGRRT
jgi:hypothetical protein